MAFLEWRRFNFFELSENTDCGKISEGLKNADLTAFSSGNGHLMIGDSEGIIHLVSRLFQINSFRAYELTLTHAQQIGQSSLLVTIGDDEPGINPLIKVWNLDKIDKQGLPLCVRISRAIPNNKPVHVTALCVHENQNIFAIGFADGSLILYRGDITRERTNKQKLFKDSNFAITGLAFQTCGKVIYLFVVTQSSVYLYNISIKDKETKTNLDGMGCAKRCCVLAESSQESQFMIGRDDAIYCYTSDGRGPCYAVEGKKIMLQWFRSYLIIIAKEKLISRTPIGDANLEPERHNITVLDIQNKFIVFSAVMKEINSVFTEWGSFYILGKDKKLFQLMEKDLQSKLSLLFKKNLYDVSIRIAKSHQYDEEGLINIFRQYGDHLYSKGDYNAAIEQYIKTVGKLEPSYVIRKFLDSQHIDKLTLYLQALHKKGHANEDHTTLLLNCYSKHDKDKLKEFIMTKDREIDFDVEIAIKVCRQASSEDALILAEKHGKHEWYLKIQIEDRHNYKDALEYISNLDFAEAEENMKLYGNVLVDNVPSESTEFLKKLCTNYKASSQPLVDQIVLDGGKPNLSERANPSEFIPLFLHNPDKLGEFLEYLVNFQNNWPEIVYNTLLENYLNKWNNASEDMKLEYETKIMKIIHSLDSNYNKNHILILCQIHNFKAGIMHLYEEAKLYLQIVQYHSKQKDYNSMISSCRRFGNQDPNLWVQALWSCCRDPETPNHILSDILNFIEKEKLLSPLLVADALSNSKTATLGEVRSYLLKVLQSEKYLTTQELQLIEKYKEETQKIRDKIETIKSTTIIFQCSRCSACNHQLELPSVHFVCQHSYHQHCFQSFTESDNECPACLPENKNIFDIIKSQEQSRDLHEKFHSQLEGSEDGFSLVADYFGRGIFNKLTLVNEINQQNPPIRPNNNSNTSPKMNYGAGAEARLRQMEGHSNIAGAKVQSEGRMRLEENKYNSSLSTEINFSELSSKPFPINQSNRPSSSISSSPFQSSSLSKSLQINKTPSSNPFEDDYDETMNPFSDDPKNPFEEDGDQDDDYDKNLNPFAN